MECDQGAFNLFKYANRDLKYQDPEYNSGTSNSDQTSLRSNYILSETEESFLSKNQKKKERDQKSRNKARDSSVDVKGNIQRQKNIYKSQAFMVKKDGLSRNCDLSNPTLVEVVKDLDQIYKTNGEDKDFHS